MAALHVVGEDLELRLGVDLRVRREQEIVVALARVGMLRIAVDQHPAVEDAPPAPVEEALVDLLAPPARLAVVDPGMEIDVLAPARDVEAVQHHLRPGPVEGDVDPVANEPASELHRVRSEAPPGRDARVDVAGMPGGIVLLEEEMVLDGGALADRDAGERIRELRSRPVAEVVLDEGRPGCLSGDHEHDRVTRDVDLSPRDEDELDGKRQPDARGDRDHCPVAEEGPVERRECVAVRELGEVGLHPAGIGLEDVGERFGEDPRRQLAARTARAARAARAERGGREAPVQEDEPDGAPEPLEALRRRDPARSVTAGRIEAKCPALDRPDVRVLPVFVPGRGKTPVTEAIEGFAAHLLHPADAGSRKGGVRRRPLPPVVLERLGHQAARSSRRWL